jgi:hypothetical protein
LITPSARLMQAGWPANVPIEASVAVPPLCKGMMEHTYAELKSIWQLEWPEAIFPSLSPFLHLRVICPPQDVSNQKKMIALDDCAMPKMARRSRLSLS